MRVTSGAAALTALAAIVVFAGCTATRQVELVDPDTAARAAAREPAPPAEPAPEPIDVTPLLDALDEAIADYAAGIDLIAAGDEVAGEELILPAADRIAGLTNECAAVEGCPLETFVDAYRELLNVHGIVLKRQSMRLLELETSAAEAEDVEREPGTSPFVSEMPALGETTSMFRGTDIREVIELNAPVKAALDDWLTWMRPTLMEAYENYQFLRADIAPIYEEAGLPEALLFAMIATESGGKVHSYSRAGAAGLLQFMRYTGRHYGLGTQDGFDMRLDPTAATQANVAYLNDRFAELSNDLEKALAAYNGGEGRMRTLNRRFGGATLWDSRVYYSLPRETREYVPRILAAAWLFLHADEYNLDFPTIDTSRAEIRVQRETTLSELTICLGQEGNPNGWFRTLRNLNPRLEPADHIDAGTRLTVPASLVSVYAERCVDNELLARARELHDANYPDEGELIPYIVRRGDTLGRIAARHRCVSIGELAAINNIRAPRYVIRVGQRINIPSCP